MRKIRKVEEGDIQKVVDIELESLGPLYDSEDINFERGRLKKYLREFMSMDRMILIEDEDEILGFLHSRSYDDVVSGKKIREILTITIHPEYFGEGLGKELMEYERKDAKKSNCDVLKLEVLSSNERAIEFYEERGFDEKKKIMTDEISKDK
ncbi:MAG: GNAT family N-acetyltransferase [Thermoplasmatota archaeon]